MLNNFLFFIAGVLTILIPVAIIKLRNRHSRTKGDNIRQSSIFLEMKQLMPDLMDVYLNRETQAQSYEVSKPVNYIEMPDKKIYWLERNTIYYAEAQEDGRYIVSDRKRSNMKNLSQKEVAKMLFIYNSLKNG